MRYAPRVRKISMFILFLESFLENDENVLSELCSSFSSESSYVDIGIIASNETYARGNQHATVAKTASVRLVYSAHSQGRLTAVTPGLTHSNGPRSRVGLLP